MCCCGTAVINGERGYSWDGKTFGICKAVYADLEEGDDLVRDLPGRCGGVDSHSHDFRIVRQRITGLHLLVHHGGGSDRVALHAYGAEDFIQSMSENDCYWMMRALYDVRQDAARKAQAAEASKWRKAAVEKRIKTRKQRGRDVVEVWIENRPARQGAFEI
jgi:hypothetical protein